MRIVFMGTPDFAVASLKRLVEANHNVVGVVTAPDKPAGRGRRLRYSAVKEYALAQELPLFQPPKLKDPDWLNELEQLRPELIVVVAFRMLPEVVWRMPSRGTINLHASLLPQYRGAAPINWAIINGETTTGATTFFINENIDTGAIIDQLEVSIAPTDNAGSLHDKLMEAGAGLLLTTVDGIRDGNHQSRPQNTTGPIKMAPKIFKEDTRIDFSKDAKDLYDFIRGLSPYPAATCELHSGDKSYGLKVFKAELVEGASSGSPGKLSLEGKNKLMVNCGKGALKILSLQLAGKKRMEVEEFLNGFKPSEDARLA